MKMMLRISVLSMMIAASLSAAESTSTSHAGAAGQQPPAVSTPGVQPPTKDPVAELVDKVNACVPGRSGIDVAEITKQLLAK